MHLTIHLQGLPTIAGQQTTPLPTPGQHAPIMLVAPNGQEMPPETTSTQRLSAVKMPEYAQPKMSDLQREHLKLLDIFEGPDNLVVADYAKLVGKSRRWITYEIQAGNLLSIQLGNKGQRVPVWQLEPLKRQLIQCILRQTPRGVDTWEIYHALQRPHESLGNLSPLDAVTHGNMATAVRVVLEQCLQQDALPALEEYQTQVKQSVHRLVQNAFVVNAQKSMVSQ